jgi:hypothetical protein
MSALPSEANITEAREHVGYGPETDMLPLPILYIDGVD